MTATLSPRATAGQSVGLALAATALALAGLLPGPARAQQMSPEEHAKHHPGAAQPGAPPPLPPSNATAPANPAPLGAAQPGQPPSTPPAGPGSGEMGDMMKGMVSPGTPPLFPSLMELPSVSPERRDVLQRQAHERMKAGAAVLSDGLDRLSRALPDDNYAAMQDATARMREGLEQFESGLAGHHALAEGRSPRQAALQWFKGEMNLQPPQGVEARGGLFGVTLFHLFTMVVLIAFALAMVAMYFFKMRRAAALFARIEAGAPPGSAPPLLGAPGPTAPVAPPAAVAEATPAP
ncbi:MAG: hypothetical protein BGO49_19110 [Planctomycetales bacterium 71-10]|nr:MAG: hypothetical protein BGO49_19110 [Planctomycetales bacterium 71-10]